MSPITSVILDPVAAYPFASTRIRGVSLDGIAKSHFAVLPARPTKVTRIDRKSTRLNSSHSQISYAVFCLKKKNRRPPFIRPPFQASLHLVHQLEALDLRSEARTPEIQSQSNLALRLLLACPRMCILLAR